MGFIKANAFMIGFGLVCLLSLGATGWGIVAGESIEQRLETIRGVTRSIQNAGSRAVNRAVIEDRSRQLEEQKRQSDEAADVALAVQRNNALEGQPRRPLVDGALPDPETTAAMEFKRDYAEAVDDLTVRLGGGERPSADDILREKEILDGGGVGGQLPSLWDPQAFAVFGAAETPDRERTSLDVLRAWPEALAAFRRAGEIRMYVSSITEEAFAKHRITDSHSAPRAGDIWQAQMALWIQQDMAAALARCNDERADVLRAAGRRVWVANMPVKHLKRVAIDNQIGSEGGGGGASNTPKSEFAISFTGRENNQDFFVIPLQLWMVVEEAALPNVLEKLCAVGFYTPISVSYEQITPNPSHNGYIYGSDPVIGVVIDLEGVFVHHVYQDWIPESLKNANVLHTPRCAIEGDVGGGRGDTRFGNIRG